MSLFAILASADTSGRSSEAEVLLLDAAALERRELC